MPRCICVIPARRGSKRLRLKNILPIHRKPVIAYSIIEAAKVFDDVYVATEDKEIQKIALKYGAKVPFLVPKKLAGDKVPSWEPCVYLLEKLEQDFDTLVCLQPTSVLKKAKDIKDGLKIFLKEKRDFLVSVTPIDPHYFHWAMQEKKKDWEMYFKLKYMKDRHELPPVFRPNGAIKIAKVDKLKKYGHFFGKNLGVSFMPEERSIHIMSDFDMKVAALMLK